MNKKLSIIGIMTLLVLGVGLSQVPEEELNLTELENCYEERGTWYCYRLSPVADFPLQFAEDLECYSNTDDTCIGDDCIEIINTCYAEADVLEDTEIRIDLYEVIGPERIEETHQNKTLEKGENLTTRIHPKEVDYTRCRDPELESEGIFEDIYVRTCEYKGEKYLANGSYYPEEIVEEGSLLIYEMGEKPERSIWDLLPSLPTLILITIVIIVGTWALYPKIAKEER